MSHPEKLTTPDKHQPPQKVSVMQAYQFDYQVNTSRTIALELPVDAPAGLAQIIVLFPGAPRDAAEGEPGGDAHLHRPMPHAPCPTSSQSCAPKHRRCLNPVVASTATPTYGG